MNRDTQIAMLWMRGSLSFLEQLCVQSFLDAGHHVVLYSYEPIGQVPDGVEFRDAGEILPEKGFLVHERTGSPALHSDVFRYRLLENADRTIWADTDAYCRLPFRPIDGHLYGWESDHHVNGGVLGLPSDSPTLHALLAFTRDEFAIPPWEKRGRIKELKALKDAGTPLHVGEQTWGVWGPHAITHFLGETGEIKRALPQTGLYPYSFKFRRKLVLPNVDHSGAITDETQSIHLYGRRIRKRLAESDHGLPNPDSLIGSLLIKHKIDPCEAPLRDWPNPDRDASVAKIYRAAASGQAYPSANVPGAKAAPNLPEIRPLEDVVAITTMKNEGPFILDWVAYHLSVGITHFLVYTNDCSDPTNEVLDALAKRGLVSRVDNPVKEGERPQRVALAMAQEHPKVRAADAYVVMDVDEYINVHIGEGTLSDLFRAANDPDMISMTWRFFGSSGVVDFEDKPVAAQFTQAAPHKVRKPHQNWGFKTIVRHGSPFGKMGVHRPLDPREGTLDWTNGSGLPMPEKYREGGWRSNKDCWGYDHVTLNHYAIRSLDSFLVKRDRGRTNHITRDQGTEYWNLHNRNDEGDNSIFPRLERARPIRKMFEADPEISALHRAAVDWHRNRAEELKKQDGFAELYARIKANPLSNTLDPLEEPETKAEPQEKQSRRKDPGLPPVTPDGAARRFTMSGDPIVLGHEAEDAYASLQDRAQRFSYLQPLGQPLPRKKVTIITSMRNEAPFILEWIAYHKSIGVTDFLVFTNDCDDPTNAILDRLADLGHVTRIDNPFDASQNERPQWAALKAAQRHPLVKDADWRIVSDVDEFINVHVGDGTLDALFSEMNDPNVVSLTWKFFGNDGVDRYEDGFVTEQFTQAAPRFIPKPRLGWGFKSLTHRSAPFKKLGVHRPQQLDEDKLDDVRWVNGAGRVMPEQLVTGNGWRSTKRTIGYEMATLNHYVLRSAESYLIKRQRGRINHVDQDQGQEYWARRNYATDVDDTILRFGDRTRAAFDGLLADDALAALHAQSVVWHKGRIKELMQQPDYRKLYETITAKPHQDAVFHYSQATPLVEAAE